MTGVGWLVGWALTVHYRREMSPDVGAPPHLVSLWRLDRAPAAPGLMEVNKATAVTCEVIRWL